MAGGGSRRAGATEDVKIGTGNVFAALETLKKKKKKPASDKAGTKGGSRAAKGQEPPAPKPAVFWAPAPLTTKSWADVEDDDDDDYFATTAPPPRPVWGDAAAAKDRAAPAVEEVGDPQQPVVTGYHGSKATSVPLEMESEDDGLDDEVDDDAEDEHEHEAKDAVPAETTVKNVVAPPVPPKDTERQLSKKELKKKELAELDAVLAELGLGASSNSNQDETDGKKGADQVAGEKKEDAPAPLETKNSKKKKSKKDKSPKEPKEAQDQVDGSEEADEDTVAVDVKERIKKVASMKKRSRAKRWTQQQRLLHLRPRQGAPGLPQQRRKRRITTTSILCGELPRFWMSMDF
ncbi:hypothetical protein PR202_gb24687 [Eleusine coracana subsp. coracana]|uniref:Uncharacterized protein n=1 Tax=Eleusine coracana subsp. coracana TaxID=191504 RepID=A0AAV5FJB5_ELECO|nr:hypothetical protein PR202_gb24687 [Eleusine coracana subsp. coracana]